MSQSIADSPHSQNFIEGLFYTPQEDTIPPWLGALDVLPFYDHPPLKAAHNCATERKSPFRI